MRDPDLTDSDRTYFCYDERWRVIASYRDSDSSPKERFVYHAAGMRGMGGSSYIDSVVLRRGGAQVVPHKSARRLVCLRLTGGVKLPCDRPHPV